MEKKSSIIGIGLTIANTPVELREKMAVPEAEWPRAIEELCAYPHIEEAACLSTCNRMELYVVALSWHRGVAEVRSTHTSASIGVYAIGVDASLLPRRSQLGTCQYWPVYLLGTLEDRVAAVGAAAELQFGYARHHARQDCPRQRALAHMVSCNHPYSCCGVLTSF